MATIEQLEARLTELEGRLPPAPTLQANPPVTIGELADVPAPGSPIASTWAQEATARVVHRFANAAARAAAFPAPAKGTLSYLTAGDINDGPEYYDGVSWRKPWNLPWGLVAPVAQITVAQPGIATGVTDLAGFTATFTAVAGRLYRIDYVALFSQTVASGGAVFVRLYDGGGLLGIIYEANLLAVNQLVTAGPPRIVSGLAAGAHTLKLAATQAGSGTLSAANDVVTGQYSVTDIGPVAGAPT